MGWPGPYCGLAKADLKSLSRVVNATATYRSFPNARLTLLSWRLSGVLWCSGVETSTTFPITITDELERLQRHAGFDFDLLVFQDDELTRTCPLCKPCVKAIRYGRRLYVSLLPAFRIGIGLERRVDDDEA